MLSKIDHSKMTKDEIVKHLEKEGCDKLKDI